MVAGKRWLGLTTGSSSPSSSTLAVACSGGLLSKTRDGAAPVGFGGTPYLVGDTRVASSQCGSIELCGAVAVDGEKCS
jgi:hypothetical protein